MRKVHFIAMATVLCIAAAARAEIPKDIHQWVPASHQVTIRVELAKLLEAPQLSDLHEIVLTPERHLWLDTVAEATGVDLRVDVDRILLAGYLDKARKQDGLVILQGTWNQERLRNFFREMPEHETVVHAGQTLLGFWSENDGEMRYALCPGEDAIAIGRLEVVKECAEALNDPAKRLEADETYRACRDRIGADAVVAVASLPPDTTPRKEIDRVLLGSLRGVYASVTLGERVDVDVNVGLVTPDAQTAQAGKEIVEGLLSFASLFDSRPVLKQLASQIRAGAQNDTVVGLFHAEASQTMELIQLVKRGGKM